MSPLANLVHVKVLLGFLVPDQVTNALRLIIDRGAVDKVALHVAIEQDVIVNLVILAGLC